MDSTNQVPPPTYREFRFVVTPINDDVDCIAILAQVMQNFQRSGATNVPIVAQWFAATYGAPSVEKGNEVR